MANKSFFLMILTLLGETILVAIFAPPSWMSKANDIEYDWMRTVYSEDTMEWVEEKTISLHHLITRETGIAEKMHWMFFPSEEAKAREGAMSRLGDKVWFPFLESRGRTLDEMIKISIARALQIIIWLPLIVLLFIPAVFDGFMERKIKQYTFKYPSPFLYRYGARGVIISLFLLAVGFFSPFPMPPILLPALIMLSIAIAGFVVIGNLPKRL